MAKRFTDTEKWKDPFFHRLTSDQKLFYFYALDNCDCAGIWKASFDFASFSLGFTVDELFLSKFGNRIVKIDAENYIITKFVEFQYGRLKEKNNAHLGVKRALLRFDLLNDDETGLDVEKLNTYSRASEGLRSSSGGLTKDHKYKNKNKNRNRIKLKKDNTNLERSEFDFEKIYAEYPRKEGKKKGFEKLRKIITDPAIFSNVMQSVINYAAICKRDGTERKYIKHFSTFIGEWEDFLEVPDIKDPLLEFFEGSQICEDSI